MLEFIEKRAISDTLLNMDSAKGLQLNMLFWTLRPMLSISFRIQKSPLTLLKRHDRQKATLKFMRKKTKLTKNQPNETNLVKISDFLPVKFAVYS